MGGINGLMIQLTPFLAFVIPQMVSESVMFGEAGFENKRQEGSFVLSWRAIGREREFDGNGIVGE